MDQSEIMSQGQLVLRGLRHYLIFERIGSDIFEVKCLYAFSEEMPLSIYSVKIQL